MGSHFGDSAALLARTLPCARTRCGGGRTLGYHDRRPMPKTPESELVTVGGREVTISNPDKVLFPEAGHTKLDLVRYYLAVADGALRGAGGRPNVLVRYPNGIGGEFFYQKRAPAVAAAVDRGGRAALSVRPHRRGGGAARRRGARLDGEPRLPRAASASGPRRRPRSSRRAARRSRSGARRGVGAGPRGRARGARDARRLRPRRLAEDLGLARHARLRAHRAALDVRRGAPRRAGAGARGRAARAGARHQQVVEGGAPRRVPRLQPEREGPHGGRRLLGAADARRARVGAADLGRARTLRARRLHARDDAGAVRRGRRPPCRHRRASGARSTRCSSCRPVRSARAWATRRGRRTTEKQAGEPPRVQPSRRRTDGTGTRSGSRSIEIGARADEGCGAGRARALEGAPSRGRRAPRARRRAGGRDARPLHAPGRASASTSSMCRRRCGRRRNRSIPTRRPTTGAALRPDGPPRRRPSRARKAP